MTAGVDRPYAAVRETHSGVVFLVGDRAVKLKKPVDLGFLDFRDPALRRACCRREVDLNRRLAPDVYLGVAEFVGPDPADTESLVLMRRMPDSRRLSTLVREGVPVTDDVARIARMVAAFHVAATRSPAVSDQGTRAAIEGRWAASLAQVDPLANDTLGHRRFAEISGLVGEFLTGRDPLFARRIATGRIVDGHGDLIADDIFCLPDGPRILDCLDFDDRLRFVDGLDDICFLAMDLERLGAPELGRLLLRHYADLAGDPAPASLRHHFIAYRAFVRCKVSCLRNAQGDPTGAGESVEYADLSIRHLRAGVVRMILVGGLPGSGKSTLAGLIADRLGAVVQATDRLRKERGRGPARVDGVGTLPVRTVRPGQHRSHVHRVAPTGRAAARPGRIRRPRRLVDRSAPACSRRSGRRSGQCPTEPGRMPGDEPAAPGPAGNPPVCRMPTPRSPNGWRGMPIRGRRRSG